LFIGLLSFHIIINNTKENLFYFCTLQICDVRITNICDTKSIINDKNMDTVTTQILPKPEEKNFEQSLL